MLAKLAAIGLLALMASNGVRAEEYDYGHQSNWYDSFQECSKNRQSPIELNSIDAVVTYDVPNINFRYYDLPYESPVICENNGHTANLQLPKPLGYVEELWISFDRLSPHISGGPLPNQGRFVAESIHFHWGSRDTHGSEHVIDSQRFTMEMHMVHRNTKYRTVEEAREHPDGLAVLAVLYMVNSNLTEDFAGLSRIIDSLESITKFSNTAELANFTIGPLMGELDRSEFYTYEGSLTTPPCSQAVTWIIFTDVIQITHNQMDRFHVLSDAHGERLENNYRSLQAKGNRKVYLRHKRKITDTEIEKPGLWELP